MIIEFYGLPGSGKTTIARKLKKKEGFNIIKINNKKELLFYNFLFLIKHPVKFFCALGYLVGSSASHNKLLYYKFMNTFLIHNAKYEKAVWHGNAIIDQGHFQNIISVFEDKLTLLEVEKYIKFLPFPDRLVIFDIDTNNRLNRIAKRGYSARDEENEGYLKKWVKVTYHNDKIIKHIIKQTSGNCLFVDGGMGVDEICGEVLKYIKR